LKPLIQLLSFAKNVNNKLLNKAIGLLESKPADPGMKDIHRWSVSNPNEAIYFLKERVMAIVGANAANPVLIISPDDAWISPRHFKLIPSSRSTLVPTT
jgi:hypothetical protein